MVTPIRSAALVAVLMLAACKPPAPAATAPAAPAPPPATTTPTGMKNCVSANLTVKRIGEDAGAGQRQVVYSLTNKGAAACFLQGVPNATWYDASGKPLDGVAYDPDAGPADKIVIQPGDRAAFSISFTGIQATDKACVSSTTMKLIPPGETNVIELNDEIDPCTDRVSLNAVRPANPDDDSLSPP